MSKSVKQRFAALSEAESELNRLRDGLAAAYSVFNNTADPELLEASILEISALQSRYSVMLRNIKTISGEL